MTKNKSALDGSADGTFDPSGDANLLGFNSDLFAAAIVAPTIPPISMGGGLMSALVGAGATSGTTTSGPTTTVSSSAATAVTTTLPAWINTLTTASIKTDISKADVNGTMTYAGLETTFADLDTALINGKRTLTAAEMADLKTIAAHLNDGVSTSAYLAGVTNALVNGNAQNATWTGGTASSVSLGNLATGSSATQMTELLGKWFLGTDLPNSKVLMSGASTFSVSYSTNSNPLYGSSGPSMNDINQGYLGDCYLLSGLAEVAHQNASNITNMITSNGNGTYGVRFYENGVAQYVTVNSQLANGGTIFNTGSDIWASLVEKAYAQLQAGGVVTGNSSVNYGNSFSTIGNGGQPFYALEEITGASQLNYYGASGGSWNNWKLNSSFQCTASTGGNSTASVLSTLVSDLAKGDDVILTSNTNATDSAGHQTLVAGHALSIYGYDSATNMLQVRNPWGAETGQYWDTTFEVSLATLLAAGDGITVDNVGNNATPKLPAPPTITNQTAAQSWQLGKAVNFTLPTNTFSDPQNQKLTYSATQSNGSVLPTWLTFNAATGTFTGTPPNTATPLTLKVTATDTSGLSVSETFNVTTPAAAPTISSQTAAQSWQLGKAVNFTLAANTFTDPQNQKLTYSATQSNGSALPTWLTFNAATGTFTGTPPNTATPLTLKVTATDTSGLSVSETFNVTTPAAAPTISSQTATQTWKLGQTVNFALPANAFVDPQGEKLTYSASVVSSSGATSALPTWLTFNAATDSFSGITPTTATGMALKVTATNTSGLSVSETIGIATAAYAPTVTSLTKAQGIVEGSKFSLALPTNTFTDGQGEALNYTATQANGSALPSWLQFNAATDTFSGTAPTTASTLSLKVTATDTSGLSVAETFSAVVNTAALMAQAIASAPASSSVTSAVTQLISQPPTVLAAAH